MPREAKPRWSERRNQWSARVGDRSGGRAKAVYFPKSIRSEADAWDYFRQLIDRRRGNEVDAADPSFGDLVDLYLAWMLDEVKADRMGADTVKVRKSMLNIARNHRLRTGGQLGDLKARRYAVDHHDDLLTWMLGKGYSPHYAQDMGRAVAAMLSWAVQPIPGREPRKILAEHPVAGYKLRVAPERPARYIAQPDMRRFLRWAWAHARRPHMAGASSRGNPITRDPMDVRFDRVFALMLHVLRLTGARPKELRIALWSDVDWEKGTIDLTRHKNARKSGRQRTIYLTPPAIRILRRLHSAPWKHPTHVFAHALSAGAAARGWARETGEPWATTAAIGKKLREWKDEAAGAGVPAAMASGASRLVAYVNRHSYITDALLEGASAPDVAKMVGNSATVIENTYDHAVKVRLSERAKEIESRRRKSGRQAH